MLSVAAVVMSSVPVMLMIPEVMVAEVPLETVKAPRLNAEEVATFCVVAEVKVRVLPAELEMLPLFAKFPPTVRSRLFMLKLLLPFTVKFPFTMVEALCETEVPLMVK